MGFSSRPVLSGCFHSVSAWWDIPSDRDDFFSVSSDLRLGSMASASAMADGKNEGIEQEQGNSEGHSAVKNCTKIQEIIISEVLRIQAKEKRPDLQSLPQAVESRSVCEDQIQKMLNKGLLKNFMSHGAKSLMLVKNGDVVNIEKQNEIKENDEEQVKEKDQETSIEIPGSRRTQEKPEKVKTPSNMDEALNVG